MDLKVSAKRLCLLLSWQEVLHRTPHSAPFAGRSYRKRAARAIADLRRQAKTAIGAAGARLQAQMSHAGDGADAESIRHEIHQLNHLLKAAEATDLGGPIAMTLEGYADAFGTSPQRPFSFTPLGRRDFITVGVSVLIIVAVCLGMTWHQLWRDNTTFTVEKAGNDHLALSLTNDGQLSAEFIGPWPSVVPKSEHTTYGVSVSCKPKGEENFQPCSSIGGVWIYQNEIMAPDRRIAVEPGVSITVILDIRALESAYGAPLDSVRIECGPTGRRRQSIFTESIIE